MFVAQCLLALFVIMGDLPNEILSALPRSEPRSPTTAVPVTPGNQTRQFEPKRLPIEQPSGLGFQSDGFVSPRLEFHRSGIGGDKDAVLLTELIAQGDALRFNDWLKELADPPSAFALHPPGGQGGEALEIGRTIRGTGLPVMVVSGASCFSACPYILAGGTAREVSRGGRGWRAPALFRQEYLSAAFLLMSDIQVGQSRVMAYLAEMGIDPMIMAKALMTPPDTIYILMPEELEDFKLSTVLTD